MHVTFKKIYFAHIYYGFIFCHLLKFVIKLARDCLILISSLCWHWNRALYKQLKDIFVLLSSNWESIRKLVVKMDPNYYALVFVFHLPKRLTDLMRTFNLNSCSSANLTLFVLLVLSSNTPITYNPAVLIAFASSIEDISTDPWACFTPSYHSKFLLVSFYWCKNNFSSFCLCIKVVLIRKTDRQIDR